MPIFPHVPDNSPDAELSVPELLELLGLGIPIDLIAEATGSTPLGLVVAGIEWLAAHRDTISGEEHALACTLLADAIRPQDRGVDPR